MSEEDHEKWAQRKMLCPKCQQEGLKSRVYVGIEHVLSCSPRCAPHYDEEGNYHYHCTYKVEQSFSCSEGHVFMERVWHECPNPNCDWKEKEDENRKP